NNWDLYQPRTLKEFAEDIGPKAIEHPDVLIVDDQKKVSIIISYDSFQSRVNLIYTGESRKVSDSRKEVISIWLKTFGKPSEFLDLFENEYLFKENGVEYWLPVQEPVALYFPDEL